MSLLSIEKITDALERKWADDMERVEKLSRWYATVKAAGIEPPHFDFLLALANECCLWRMDATNRRAERVLEETK